MTLDTAADYFGSGKFWFDATILTALASFVWSLIRRLTEIALFRIALRTKEIDVSFRARPDVPDELHALRCLMVRYGNDAYLHEMASDLERYHGRLRNRILPVTVSECEDGGRRVTLRIKLHKRLGTQFKFFVDVMGDPEPVIAYLGAHENVYDISLSPRPGQKKRIFFLVRDYPSITTIDGFENNMIWPV